MKINIKIKKFLFLPSYFTLLLFLLSQIIVDKQKRNAKNSVSVLMSLCHTALLLV